MFLSKFFRFSKAAFTERRKYPRLEIRNLVKITNEDDTETYSLTNVLDISEGGLRIVCHNVFKIDTILNIIIQVPEKNTSLTLKAKVIWLIPMKKQKGAFNAGLQYVDISDTDRQMIRDIVNAALQGKKKAGS